MAAEMGLSPEILETEAFPPDKVLEKRAPRSGLMERLRSRCSQHKSWTDSVKAIRMAIANDKRLQADALEKSSLQSCLDKLHRAMKITNQQSLIERLDLISRQLGMIFTPPSHLDNQVVLSSEMFKVVVVLEGQSGIRDVKVGHQETPVSCEDLVEVLSKGNFEEFVIHLQGLLAIYSIHGDRKQKNKGYLALSSLEYDLNQLAQLQSSINGVANYIHKSPLGILLPRRGGHPMKLIYFVSPYDLLCKKTKSSYPMTVEAITENGLGHSVTVSLEPCSRVNKLQTIPLMTVRMNQDGKSLPSFQNVNNINSYSLSASFVLVLPQPIPVARSVIDAIRDITGLDVVCDGEMPFLSVLMKHSSDAKLLNKNELFVTLPDQQHVYFFNNNADGCLRQPGALVSKIPFTLPTCVPKVLNLLRQQLMFNSIMHSLIRPNAKREYRSGVVFELTAVSLQYLSLMFEHPLHHSMITVEFDLSDLTSVQCNVDMSNKEENIWTDDFVSRAFQRSFSIPVTLRTVIQKVNEQIRQLVPPEPVVKPVVKSRWTWTRQSAVKKLPSVNTNTSTVSTQNMVSNFPNPPPYQNTEGWTPNQQIEMHKYTIQFNQTPFTEPTVPAPEEFHEQRPAANPLLATLLDAGSPSSELPAAPVVNESPMLSKLLEENTSVASNPFPAPTPNPRKRLTKRKPSKDIAGKSPKHRISESEMAERTSNERIGSERHGQGMGEKHIDLDSSGGSYEELGRPSSVSSVGSVGGQSTGSVIDLTDIGESHVKKLENSLDSIMGKESPRSGAMGMGHPLNSQISGLDMLEMYPTDFHHGQNPNQLMSDGSADFHPPQWPSRQTPPTPTSRNSPHHGVVPKNEKASTSHEELLLGPGGREIEGPNSAQSRRNSQQRRPSFKRQNSLTRNNVDSASGGVSPDVFSPLMTSPSHHPLASPGQFPIASPSYIVSPGIYPQMSPSQITTVTSPSLQNVCVKNEPSDSKAGIIGSQTSVSTSRISNIHVGHVTSSGKPSLSMMKAQLDMRNDVKQNSSAITQERDGLKEENSNSSSNSQPPLMKLKLSNVKQYENVSPADSDTSKRSSTFDFHSDDEDFTLPMVEKMTVVSASPTRLQISNKSTLASFNRFNKSEKFKRKQQRENELKITLSVDSGKRKREKDESRKEHKKKKMNSSYSIENEMAVYKSTTVSVDVGNENDHLPKLKITKKRGKMSVENSVLHTKDEKVDKVDKTDREAVVKIEKIEKSVIRDDIEKEIKYSKDKITKQKDKNVDKDKTCGSVSKMTASDEGIFDKINAMKSENLSKNDSVTGSPAERNVSHDSANKKTSSSKSVKSHKSQRSSSSKSESKMSRTPTIKLKPIVVPSSSSGLTVTRNPSTPSTPSTPKTITQSPTSTTIGKIGAVSLATSGSQKQLPPSSNKSPQGLGSGNKSSAPSRSSSGSASSVSSKSSSGMQKNLQIQGSSGKNSPIPQSSKSGHSRSLSSTMLNSGSGALKLDKSKSVSSSSLRTSSPHSDKEKSKSSFRSSSSSGRDREKSTSSSKASVPTTTVITQETAASVLSFLNPKANKIAKLPPIPKLSSTAGSQKVSTPTSTNNPIVSTTTAPTYSSTSTTNSKFAKGSNPITNVSKSNATNTVNSSKSNSNISNNMKNHYVHNKGNGGSSNVRPQNQLVTNTANSGRNSGNSPQSYTHKHEKGGNNSYNKGSNQSSSNNSSSGYRNTSNYNSGNNSQNRNSNVHSAGSHSNWANNSGGANPHSKTNNPSNSNPSGFRGSNPSHSVNKGSNSNSDSSLNRTHSVSNSNSTLNSKGSNSAPNAPKGPGPPLNRQQSVDKNKSGSSSVNSAVAQRGRKGSLSAVIDKLTCKASVPTSNASQKVDQVIVNESPASPEMENSVVPVVQEESKVVIFDAPASPEPESCANSAPKNRINSAREIISIPLENEPENANNTSSYASEQTGSKFNNCERKKNYASQVSSVTQSSSPKIIPLTSFKDKPSPNKNSPVNKKSFVKQGNAEIVNSIDKQNGEVDDHHIKPVSSSNDISNSYCNSQGELLVNDSKAKDNVFKTPSSKPQENSDINTEDIENLGGRRNYRQSSVSKTMSDPNSPASSPENGLIIDFPSSPRHLQNKTNSPQCNPVSDTYMENRTSPNFLKSPGVKSKLKGSPSCSPSGKEGSSLGSSANSPETIDDDLMDAALGFGD